MNKNVFNYNKFELFIFNNSVVFYVPLVALGPVLLGSFLAGISGHNLQSFNYSSTENPFETHYSH